MKTENEAAPAKKVVRRVRRATGSSQEGSSEDSSGDEKAEKSSGDAPSRPAPAGKEDSPREERSEKGSGSRDGDLHCPNAGGCSAVFGRPAN